MNPDREKYLNLRTKPGKVTVEEAAWHLGFGSHEVPVLLASGLLKPLGKPSKNGCKYFSPYELDKLNQNTAWLNQACDTVTKCWRDRNLKRAGQETKAKWPNKRLGGAFRTGQGPKPLTPRPNRQIKP